MEDPTTQVWRALGGEPLSAPEVVRTGGAALTSVTPVAALARTAVEVCAMAAAEFTASGAAGPAAVPGPVRCDAGGVAAAFTSERHLRVDGRPPALFAPLSRFWRTSDGWVRTHANYPHHRDRLLTALGLPQLTAREQRAAGPDADAVAVEAVAAELADRSAVEVERAVQAAGGLAVAVRTPAEWAAHPQGRSAARRPLPQIERLDDAAPRRAPYGRFRVLDLTRVIAGPVATRTLALLGADVLRIDPPWLPESADAHADTGFGKRSAVLDLSERSGRSVVEELLAGADVVVTGYRPGALDRYGLAPHDLVARHPGLVVGRLGAWGSDGPWAGRRGFDSLVQAASGIAVVEGRPGGAVPRDRAFEPGRLPAQALDHGSGYLLAAALLRCLSERRAGAAGSRIVELSLAGTAAWLLDGLPDEGRTIVPGDGGATIDPGPWLAERASPLGRLRHVRSPVRFDGGPDDWSRPPGRPGADPPRWRD